MAYNYKLHCNKCDRTFLAYGKYDRCTHCDSYNSSFVGDVVDLAADVAAAYFMVDVASDVIDGVGSLIGGFFD